MSTSGMGLTRNGYVNTVGIRHPSLHWPSVQMVPCWPLRPLTCTNRVSRRQVATWRMPSTSGKCKSTKWNPNKRSMPGFLLFKFASFPPRSGCVKLLSLLFFTHHHLLNSIQVLSISPSHTLCTSALQLVSCFHPLLFPPLLFSVFVYPSHCHIFARFHFYRELNQVVGTVVLDTTIFQVYFVLLSFFNQNIHTTEQWRRWESSCIDLIPLILNFRSFICLIFLIIWNCVDKKKYTRTKG